MRAPSLLKTAYFHACIPPLVIFFLLAQGLWFAPDDLHMPLTFAVFLTGAGGGVISTYFRLKDVAPTVVSGSAILQIYISPLISGLLGWICYAFFLTEMLRGPLFPEFTGQKEPYTALGSVFKIVPISTLDAAKALLWAFVAGFSEKLIPNILDKLASSAQLDPSLNGRNPAATDPSATPRPPDDPAQPAQQ
ncbi:MAG: hypothetical protein RIQ60_1493 [Pseudomonadota bacterium]|jgi:hypothetical protein